MLRLEASKKPDLLSSAIRLARSPLMTAESILCISFSMPISCVRSVHSMTVPMRSQCALHPLESAQYLAGLVRTAYRNLSLIVAGRDSSKYRHCVTQWPRERASDQQRQRKCDTQGKGRGYGSDHSALIRAGQALL